jgi:hypothetical protein
MGNTTSHQNITQENKQLYIDQDTIKSVSKQINNQISNTIIKTAKECTADINNNQAIILKGINTKGNFNFNATQNQAAALTFSCVQSSKVRNMAGSEIISDMTNALTNNISNEALSELKQNAKNSASASFGAIGNVASNTKTNAINDYKSITQNNKDIENVVKNSVENNFSSETVSHCIAQANNNQTINLQEVNVGGEAVIAIDQNQAANVVAECIQSDDIGSKIINTALGAFQIAVRDESKSVSIQNSSSEIKSTAHNAGYFESIGDLFSSIFSGIGGIFGHPGAIIASVCCCIVILVLIMIVGYIIKENPEILALA